MQGRIGRLSSGPGARGARRSLVTGTVMLALLAAAAAPTLAGCSAPDGAVVQDRAAGRFELGLSAELDGVQYWLEATFFVTGGTESAFLSSSRGDTSLAHELTPGSYAVELLADFRVLRDRGGFLDVVEADLLSDATQLFEIDSESTTRVAYRFAVDHGAIEFGPGELAIDFEVEPRIAPQASLRFVSPYVGTSGQPGTLVARGSDLDAAGSELTVLIGDLRIGPLQPEDATQVRIEYPGLPAGRYPVSVLSSTAEVQAELVVVDPPVPEASVILHEGPRSRLVYDAERQRLYAVNRSTQQIERYQHGGDGWSALPARTVPELTDIAMMPDGQSLVVLSRGAISELYLDDGSLTLFTQQSNPNPFCGGFFDQIAMGNDGKAMVIFNYADCSGFSNPYLYDGVQRSFASVPLGIFYNGTAAASADGTRVYAGSNGVSPAQAVVTFDTRSWTGSAGHSVAYNLGAVAVSGDASRVILQNTAVYDQTLALLGFLPSGGVALASRDSARAFVYRHDDSPRIEVYDLNGELEAGAFFPVVANFGLPEAPSSDGSLNTISMAASPDDSLVIVSGSSAIVTVPVP
jgi:hypothetical protein